MRSLSTPVRTILLSLVLSCAWQQLDAQVLALPPRDPGAPSRDAIISMLAPLSGEAREDSVFRFIMDGNVPGFIRHLVPVTTTAVIGGTAQSVTYFVTPDYMAVGSDDAYLLIPMTPLLAQRIADALHCTLPTRKMVNEIYAAAELKLAPAPIPPSAAMTTVPVFAQHDSMVRTQRTPHLSSHPPGTLIGGTKKDVIISNRIREGLKSGVPKPVVIYGWHQLNGVPIQPLYNGHGETYADYSHGIRLVLDSVQLNGAAGSAGEILKNGALSPLLSDEGAIAQPRYGDVPTDVQPGPSGSPEETGMQENYPNPFNASTVIGFRLASSAVVTLKVYDMLGRETATLAQGERGPGEHTVTFDGSGHASGVYIARLTWDEGMSSARMVLLR